MGEGLDGVFDQVAGELKAVPEAELAGNFDLEEMEDDQGVNNED